MDTRKTHGQIYFENMKELMKYSHEIENICPCCGLMRVEIWDICEICDWQNDLLQNSRPDYAGGANRESLNNYKEKWIRSQNAKGDV